MSGEGDSIPPGWGWGAKLQVNICKQSTKVILKDTVRYAMARRHQRSKETPATKRRITSFSGELTNDKFIHDFLYDTKHL